MICYKKLMKILNPYAKFRCVNVEVIFNLSQTVLIFVRIKS